MLGPSAAGTRDADKMKNNKASSYFSMLITAAGTSGSRLLGLVRDQLIAGFFGTGSFAAAFIIAFQIPNLFRRLLGEGALTSALMPVMTQERKSGGNVRAFSFFNLVICRVAPWMLLIMTVFCILALGIALAPEAWVSAGANFLGADGDVSRHRLAAWLTALCMPYMPMICIAAVFTAGLNMLGKFTVTALSAVWLNLAMIFSLGVLGYYFGETPTERVVWLCSGALLGGALQLGVPALALWREGWRFEWNRSRTEAWEDLKAMFLPAVVGAGINQINIFFTRFLAFALEEQALSVYYYANRIVEIPVGIFTVTVTTVVFPLLAKHAADGNAEKLGGTFAHGMRLIYAINIPATVGIIVLAFPLVTLFFEHGNFTAADTAATVPVLWIFALAVPFYAVSGLVGRALNSLKDTKTQTKTAGVAFALNCALAPTLGWLFGAVGLAGANLISAAVQCVALYVVLIRRERAFGTESVTGAFFKTLGAALVMGAGTLGLWHLIFEKLFADGEVFGKNLGIVAGLFIVVPVAVALYFAILKRMRFPECDEILALVFKRLKK